MLNRLVPLIAVLALVLMIACGDDSNPLVEENPDDTIIDTNVTLVPELTIPEPLFDFGYSPQYSKISHVFWLHSTGTDTLRILKVTPG